MPFVLDASVAASWAFPDEQAASAETAREQLRDNPAITPEIWWYEVRNSMLVGERRGRITRAQIDAFLLSLSAFAIEVDHAPNGAALLDLARRHRLTIYDAAYLELALRKSLDLATLDGALIQAARRERVPLVGEAN